MDPELGLRSVCWFIQFRVTCALTSFCRVKERIEPSLGQVKATKDSVH
jgi:hypothetical protein